MEPEAVLERAAWLIKSQRERVTLQEELQKVFQLDWNDAALVGKADWVKELKDPQPFNSMQWLVDVMAHDEPQYQIEVPEGGLPKSGGMGQVPQNPPTQIPMDLARIGMPQMGGGNGNGMNPEMGEMMGQMGAGPGVVPAPADDEQARRDMGDVLEKAAQEMYRQNDERSPTSLQRDELYAAFVNGMIVDKVVDMRLGSRWEGYSKRNRGASPFYIKSLNPAHVYFEWDEYGICEVFQRYLRPLKEVKKLYGGKVEGLASVRADDASGFVEFCEYWTEDVQAMWVEKIYYNGYGDENYFTGAEPIQSGYFVQKPVTNWLGFIPYALKVARGSSVFNRNNMVYPHLYSGHKSKLFLRQNLFLTVASTLAFMLVNPQLVQETDTPERPIELDFSAPHVHGIAKGDKLTPVQMQMSRDFMEVMTIIASKVEESTVSKVIAGQSPGGVTAASGINLLIGGGKLTVSSVQKAMGEVRASVTHKLFDFIRGHGQFEPGKPNTVELQARGKYQTLDPATLPDRMDIQVSYQPFMPQDRALAVQTWLQPLMAKLVSSDFFYNQTGVQDVVTLRRQIEQDKDREAADLQFQQQVQLAAQQDMAAQQPAQNTAPGNIEAGAQAEDVGMGEQPVEGVTSNPQAPGGVANELNAMMNAISNPMGG